MSLDTAFIVAIRQRLRELKESSVNTLVSGQPKDHSEYRYSCGYIKCLDDMNTITDDIVTQLQKG